MCGCALRVAPFGACSRLDCETCRPANALRRARSVKAALLARPDKRPVLYTVFTVPPAGRAQFVDRKRWRVAVKSIITYLKRYHGFEYGAECSHPNGDRDPAVFHPHVNLLWVQREGFKPLFTGEQLAGIRNAWSNAIGGYAPVDIHHQYVKRRERFRIWHRCKYMTRPFPKWAAWCGGVQWYGRRPKVPDNSKKNPCGKCGHEFKIVGQSSLAAYLKYLATGTVALPAYMLTNGYRGPPLPTALRPHTLCAER